MDVQAMVDRVVRKREAKNSDAERNAQCSGVDGWGLAMWERTGWLGLAP